MERPHSVLADAFYIVHLLWNVPGLHYKHYWTLQPVKIGGQYESQPIKWSQMIYYFIFTTFSPFPHGPKSTRLDKINFSTSKSSLSEVNFSPRWRNTIGRLLLDTMADSPVCFTIITNNISSNPIYHMVVSFLLVPIHLQGKYQEKDSKRGQTATKKFQAQRKKWNWMLPQISSDIKFLPSTTVVEHDYNYSKSSTIW